MHRLAVERRGVQHRTQPDLTTGLPSQRECGRYRERLQALLVDHTGSYRDVLRTSRKLVHNVTIVKIEKGSE